MNRLKSIFLSTYLTYAIVIGILQITYFIESWDITWLISSVIHFIPVGFIIILFLKFTPRTSAKLTYLTIAIIGAVVATALVMPKPPNQYPMLYACALVTLSGWIFYINWYSVLPKRSSEILKVGSQFPQVEFETTDKKKISTSSFLDKKTIYMFYRGNWCPLCTAQIKEIAQHYNELDSMGVQVVLISAQRHKYSENLANRIGVPFTFLTGPKCRVSKKLKLYHQGGTPFGIELLGYSSNTVLPTAIITDEKGQIIFLDQTDNYRVRPEPQTFIDILKNTKVSVA